MAAWTNHAVHRAPTQPATPRLAGRLNPNIRGSLKCDVGFVATSAMALNADISGSILAEPEACLVMMMTLPCGSTPGRWPPPTTSAGDAGLFGSD
jgi:hypothetical protein